jgi:glucose-6-phosphate isomerase
MTEDDESAAVPMERGTLAYVPPYWAHRTVNAGDEPFVFFAVYPGQAGHDYGTIETTGFAQRVFETSQGPEVR